MHFWKSANQILRILSGYHRNRDFHYILIINFKENEIDFDEVAGAYDIHSYNANFDWRKDGFGDSGWKPGSYSIADAERIMKDWIAWARSKNKPFFLTEMGSIQFGWGGSHAVQVHAQTCTDFEM